MYSVVSIILGIVTTIFTGCCLSGYYDSFVEQKKWFGKYGKYLLIIAFVVTDYILDHCFPSSYETKETLGKLMLLSVAVFLFGKLFYHIGTQMAAFLTITFMATISFLLSLAKVEAETPISLRKSAFDISL